MMSNITIDLGKVKKSDLVKEILRVGMIAELDAISLYEQLAAMTDRSDIKKVFIDITREEKTHLGEFQELLLREDKEQGAELKKGKDEVKEITGK
ncbi:MAG: rubrerythrin [Nitrospirae bacterium]|nr:rubrerythrin [Nitrospirota bacterium]